MFMGGGAFRNVVARAFSTCALSPPPLAGYRVLELQGLAAAPLAGQILADFGADVVRVDGDGKGGGVHLGASVLGRGKRSVALDLKSKEGQRKCRSLAENCDVVLEGFRPGVMERLGLGPGDLLERNPGLVFARVTGWGQDGPWASLAGHDINYCSITGALDICGDSSSTPAVRPMPPGNLMADHMWVWYPNPPSHTHTHTHTPSPPFRLYCSHSHIPPKSNPFLGAAPSRASLALSLRYSRGMVEQGRVLVALAAVARDR